MAHYIKNDINYHGARSKTRASEQNNTRKQTQKRDQYFHSQNSGSGDGREGVAVFGAASSYNDDGLWNNAPCNTNITEDDWEQERLVKGKSRKNRRFRPLTDNDLIPVSNQEVPDWNKKEAKFPALDNSKQPVSNVWEKRREKFEEIQILQPTNESEEEKMIKKALELSKIEAAKEEERRRQLEEEYKMQMLLLETDPLLFKDFRTTEELAADISKISEDVSENGEFFGCNENWLPLEKREDLQKTNAELGKKKTACSIENDKSSISLQQTKFQIEGKQEILSSSNQSTKAASNAGTISRVSKAVNMFGGWGTSQKPFQVSKEVESKNSNCKISKSKSGVIESSKQNEDVNFQKNRTVTVENSDSSNLIGAHRKTQRNVEQNSNISLGGKVISHSSESTFDSTVDIRENNCGDNEVTHLGTKHIGPKTNIEGTYFIEKHQDRVSFIDFENHIETKIDAFNDVIKNSKENESVTVENSKSFDSKADKDSCKKVDKHNSVLLEGKEYEDFLKTEKSITFSDKKRNHNVKSYSEFNEISERGSDSKSKDAIANKKQENNLEVQFKEAIHSVDEVRSLDLEANPEVLLNSICSDYVELVKKCETTSLMSKNSEERNSTVIDNKSMKSTNENVFKVLERDYLAKDSLNSSDPCNNSNSAAKEIPLISNKKMLSQMSNSDLHFDIPENEITYSLNSISQDNSSSFYNENCSNNLNNNEISNLENSSKKWDSDISLPLLNILSDNSNSNKLPVGDGTSPRIEPPKLPQAANSFPEPLAAHFPSYQEPSPPAFMNPNFMMNPILMHQMLVAYPFLLKQLQEMDGYYKSMNMPVGTGLPFYPQPMPLLAGPPIPVGQPFMNPMINPFESGQSNFLKLLSEANPAAPLIDPPVPPPHLGTGLEPCNISSVSPEISSSFRSSSGPVTATNSEAGNSWLDSYLSKEPQFSDMSFNSTIPPPTMPESSVPNNLGQVIHGIEDVNASNFPCGAVLNCDKKFPNNPIDKGITTMSDNFALPETCSSMSKNAPNPVSTVSASHKTDGWGDIILPLDKDANSSWDEELKEWECQTANSMRNSSRYASEKNTGHRQPAREPYLGRRRK